MTPQEEARARMRAARAARAQSIDAMDARTQGQVPSALDALSLPLGPVGTLFGLGARAVGAGMAAVPKPVAGALPIFGALATPSTAGEDTFQEPETIDIGPLAAERQTLMQQAQRLQQQVEQLQALKQQNTPRSRAPTRRIDKNYFAAQDQLMQLEPQLQQVQSQLTAASARYDEAVRRNSPEYREQLRRQAFERQQAEKAEKAAQPWAQRNEELANVLPYAGMALAGAAPAAVGAIKNVGTFFPMSQASRVGRAVRRGEGALAAKPSAANRTQQELAARNLDNLLAQRPSPAAGAASDIGGTLMVGGAGGALAAEASMLPYIFDRYNSMMPEDSPHKKKAYEVTGDPMNWVKNAALGTLTGMSGYKFGKWATPKRSPDWARAQAVSDQIWGRPPASGHVGASAPSGAGLPAAPSARAQALPPPSSPAQNLPPPSSPPYDPTAHGPVSRQYVDDMLTARARRGNTGNIGPEQIQADLGQRYTQAGLPMPDAADLATRIGGTTTAANDLAQILGATNSQITNPRLRQQVLAAITGKPGMLAVPFGLGMSGPMADILGGYSGDSGDYY